jgi:hypothetical protein
MGSPSWCTFSAGRWPAPRFRPSGTGRRSPRIRTTSATSSWRSTRARSAEGEFEDDLDQVIDVLHATRRADPAQPVLVAGDPKMATRAERLEQGVPIPDDLMAQLRAVAKSAGVPFLLASRAAGGQ